MTHPFHPLHGREFALLTYRHNWGENRVYFLAEKERVVSLPLEWTSLAASDPFVTVSNGRSLFRFHDLLELIQLAREIRNDR